MKNFLQLHCLVAVFPAFVSLFAPNGGAASFFLAIGAAVLWLYHVVCFDTPPYEGAHEDTKRMWTIQILGIMVNVLVFNL